MSFLSFFSGLASAVSKAAPVIEGIGLAAQAAGTVTSFIGARGAAEALSRQAGAIEQLGGEEQRFIVDQANIEADLIEMQGGDATEVLAFNEGVALRNAEWEQRAGDVAMDQARTRWESQVKDVIARFAASGVELTGTTYDVIAEQIGEMEKDLFNIGLNTRRAVQDATSQAELYSLRRKQTDRLTDTQAAARRRLGGIEAGIAGTEAASRAAAARTSARTARITGTAGAFRGGMSLLSNIAEFAS